MAGTTLNIQMETNTYLCAICVERNTSRHNKSVPIHYVQMQTMLSTWDETRMEINGKIMEREHCGWRRLT